MYLKDSKTVVIKIGSSLLINDQKIVREKWLSEFAKDVQHLQKLKKNIILVSSGAIALGCKKLKLSKKKLKLDKSQAVASIGQIELMNLFKKTFNKSKINLSQILLTLEDTEKRKEVFTKYMGTYNNQIFDLFNNKLIGEIMSEQLDIMKYLAGLLKEAPINFDSDVDTGMLDDEDDEYADKPGYTQDNMINQLGKIIDSDDAGKEVDQMKIKKFTPVTKVTTDDNASVDVSPAEAKALKSMMDMLSSARMGEEQSPREKFLDAIQTKKGLLNMIDFAYDKKIVQQTENFVAPDMNLDDIREDYDVRQDCHSKTHDCATKVIHPTWGEGKPMYESHAVPTDEGYVAWYDVEFEHGIEKEVPAEDMEIITLAEHGVTASKEYKNDTKLMAGRLKDVIIPKEINQNNQLFVVRSLR